MKAGSYVYQHFRYSRLHYANKFGILSPSPSHKSGQNFTRRTISECINFQNYLLFSIQPNCIIDPKDNKFTHKYLFQLFRMFNISRCTETFSIRTHPQPKLFGCSTGSKLYHPNKSNLLNHAGRATFLIHPGDTLSTFPKVNTNCSLL